jgi:hypothetical protein
MAKHGEVEIMPRFSLASILWLIAIIAVAAAIPHPIGYTVIERAVGGGQLVFEHGEIGRSPYQIEVEQYPAMIMEEIVARGIIVLVLLLLVWLGHVAFRRIRHWRQQTKNLSD